MAKHQDSLKQEPVDSTIPRETGGDRATGATQGEPETNPFVTVMRKVYKPLGFNKGYNVPLFVIFGGAMLGFTLARFSYLNIAGSSPKSFKNRSSPGEWYHYHQGHMRIGITLHLVTIIPAGFLAVFQFVPVIRSKLLLLHRINGYTIILLTMLSNAGALMIARRTFGGGLETQAVVGTLVVMTTVGIGMAYYNIKRLQIDQHRAWMLRTWFYFGVIITARLIMLSSARIITRSHNYDAVRSCGEIAFTQASLGIPPPLTVQLYPACLNATAATQVPVHADDGGWPEQLGVALGMSFGMAMWIALLLHAGGVELYLALTPRESERLRNVSYERQLEAGFEHPGSAGLVVERWGDASEWVPAQRVREK
ncbi:hypothetical protein BUE80_DR011909 [Diplocarpon rosae]|nr:hypothetical protein BUE80_DR011909 [Diplocarpon rosae]